MPQLTCGSDSGLLEVERSSLLVGGGVASAPCIISELPIILEVPKTWPKLRKTH